MIEKMIYMDYNATTPLHPAVLEALLPFYRENFGNPSSIHWAGRRVKGTVEEARERVAQLVGCKPGEVVFTASGSEADNMAIKGVAFALRSKGNHIITCRTEHPAVLNSCLYLEQQGFEITWLSVDENGLPNLAELEKAISDRTILMSLMYANNETGVLSPVSQISEIASRYGVYFHCDAVQAVGRVPVDMRRDAIHLLALSGHKLYAPKGIGALVVRTGVKLHSLIHGGSQERNRRAGTENVAGIAALGKACELAYATLVSESERIGRLRDNLEQGIVERVTEVRVNGNLAPRLANTSNLSFRNVAADSLLFNLDLAGIAASSGSACSSGTLKTSSVLAAMEVEPAWANGSVRFSLGRESTQADVDYLLDVLPEIVQRLRRNSEK